MSAYWQIAAGSDQRDYSEWFLKYGIAFTGRDHGLCKVKVGDIIVLKRGVTEILAVGKAIDKNGRPGGCRDKEWLLDFDGWELAEYRYVKWKKPEKPIPVQGLTRGTLKGLHQQELKDKANEIWETGTSVCTSPEPSSEIRNVKDDEILNFLIEQGVSPSSSDEITSTISKIRLLAKYYYFQYEYPWGEIGEHEIRTFLVVPFLLALGWSPQQMKIEFKCTGGKIDLAVFRNSCKSNNKNQWDSECVAILETKRFGVGLDYADQQVKSYSKIEFPQCKALIATNGYCYKLYLRDGNKEFKPKPSAYINFLRPKEKYPIDPGGEVGGALEAIKSLLPNNLIGPIT